MRDVEVKNNNNSVRTQNTIKTLLIFDTRGGVLVWHP